MDEFVQGLITGAPNLAVALLVIFWQHRQITKYAEEKEALTQRLLKLLGCPEEEDGSASAE